MRLLLDDRRHRGSGFEELTVSASHAAGTARLAPHPNDPFDRLLIAQAIAEPLRPVTADPMLAQCSDLIMLI